MNSKAYSLDEFVWYTDMSDIHETAISEDYGQSGDSIDLYVGDAIPFTHSDFISANNIIDDLSN